MNAYAKCRLVGVHRDYSNEANTYAFVYTDVITIQWNISVEPEDRGEVDKILFKTAI